jgi:hypothetical protein
MAQPHQALLLLPLLLLPPLLLLLLQVPAWALSHL